MSILDTLSVTKYIAACAKKAGIGVVFEDKSIPRTDGRTMYLPRVGASATHEEIVKIQQFVKHETSHITSSDFTILEKHKPQGLLMFLLNLIEDHRVDYLNDSEYDGDRWNTEEYYGILGATITPDSIKEMDTNHRGVIMPLFAWDLDVREDLWVLAGREYHDSMNESGTEVYNKLVKGDYSDVLRNVRTIKDPLEGGLAGLSLAERILREVFDANPESFKGDKGSEGADASGEGTDKADGGYGDASDGDKDGDGKDKGECSTEELRTIDYGGKHIPYAPHGASKGSPINATNYKVGIERIYTPTPDSDILVVNHVQKTVSHGHYSDHGKGYSTDNEILNAAHETDSIANQLRTQLQIISRDRWEFGKKKGVLNGASLYRIGLKDAKGFNERIFKTKEHTDVLDVAVQVLVDCSGSMSGSKYIAAAASAIVLNDVLGNTLRIPTEIIGFTEKGSTQVMYVFKEFDRVEARPTLADSLTRTELLDNVDGESLIWGYHRLTKRKEKRKIMIVLSDGSPCGGNTKGDVIKHTHQVIRAIEASPVEIIGIGIKHMAVEDYYTKHVCIENPKQIGGVLLTTITKQILNFR